MTNPYFDFPASPSRFMPRTKARAEDVNTTFDAVSYGFDLAYAAIGLKAPLASPTFTGVVTLPSPGGVSDSSAKAATTAWVQALVGSLSVGLPSQTGNSGKALTTDGTSASWSQIIPAQAGNAARYLQTNGSDVAWVDLAAMGSGGVATFSAEGTYSGTQGLIDARTAPQGTILTLPDARTLTVGRVFMVTPPSGTMPFGIATNDGELIDTSGNLVLTSNATQAGSWAKINSSNALTTLPTTPYVLGPATNLRATRDIVATMPIDGSRVLVACAKNSGGIGIELFVASVSGPNVAAGAITTVGADDAIVMKLVAVTGGYALVYATAAAGSLKCIGITVSGTTVSAGAETTVSATLALVNSTVTQADGYLDFACDAYGDKLLIGVRRSTTVAEAWAVQVSGTTVTPGGTPANLYTYAADSPNPSVIKVLAISASSFFVCWGHKGTTTTECRAVMVSVSGTTPTANTTLQLYTQGYFLGACLISATQVLITRSGVATAGGTTVGAACVVTISGGTTLSVAAETVVPAGSNQNGMTGVVKVSSYYFAIFAASGGNGRLACLSVSGTAVTFEATAAWSVSNSKAPMPGVFGSYGAISPSGATAFYLYTLGAATLTLALSIADGISSSTPPMRMTGKTALRVQDAASATAVVARYGGIA